METNYGVLVYCADECEYKVLNLSSIGEENENKRRRTFSIAYDKQEKLRLEFYKSSISREYIQKSEAKKITTVDLMLEGDNYLRKGEEVEAVFRFDQKKNEVEITIEDKKCNIRGRRKVDLN